MMYVIIGEEPSSARHSLLAWKEAALMLWSVLADQLLSARSSPGDLLHKRLIQEPMHHSRIGGIIQSKSLQNQFHGEVL
eukprot:6473140-Amphidinium_carterae.1